MAKHMPNKLNRSEAMTRIRGIGAAKAFEKLGLACLVLLPPMPPSKVRKKRKVAEDIEELDPDFEPILEDEEEAQDLGE